MIELIVIMKMVFRCFPAAFCFLFYSRHLSYGKKTRQVSDNLLEVPFKTGRCNRASISVYLICRKFIDYISFLEPPEKTRS